MATCAFCGKPLIKTGNYQKYHRACFKLKENLRKKEWKKNHQEYMYQYIRTDEYRKRKRVRNKTAREKRRLDIINRLGGACIKCGIQDPRVLVFHHKNGNDVRYYDDLFKSRRVDWILCKYDLSKVEVLCANCHLILHYSK